jgi:transcription antitermination factor NusG
MKEEWYALQVRPRCEERVRRHLQGKGYEVFLPTYECRRRWSDRVKSLVLPLFPSYIFSRFDVEKRLPILITPGVDSIVGAGKSPIPVDQKEISAIRSVMNSGIASQPWPYLETGDVVEVDNGPLEGLSGIVLRDKGSDRLVISVTLLRRSVSVEIDRHRVRPVESAHRRGALSAMPLLQDGTRWPHMAAGKPERVVPIRLSMAGAGLAESGREKNGTSPESIWRC